jgi:translation elongation factor EF-G
MLVRQTTEVRKLVQYQEDKHVLGPDSWGEVWTVLTNMAGFPVVGFPVVGLSILVDDGSFHTVDSSDLAFRICAQTALAGNVFDGVRQV